VQPLPDTDLGDADDCSSDSCSSCEEDPELPDPDVRHLVEKPDSHVFNLVDVEEALPSYVPPTHDSVAQAARSAVTDDDLDATSLPELPAGMRFKDIPPREKIMKMKIVELKTILKAIKVPVSGNKAALCIRLNRYCYNLHVHRGETVSFIVTWGGNHHHFF